MLLTQTQEELIQQFRFLLQRAGASSAAPGANGQNMGLVSPIGANPDIDGCRDQRELRVRLNRVVVHSMMGWASRENLAGRKPYRGPTKRQPLSVRSGQRKVAGSESLSRCMIDMGQGIRHPSRVTLFFKRNAELFTSQKSAAAKVIHIGCGELPQASSPMMNNFWNTYKGRGEGDKISELHAARISRTRLKLETLNFEPAK